MTTSANLEETPLWKDVRKIFNGTDPIHHHNYRGILHTVDADYPIMKIVTLDIVRNYIEKIGDETFIEFQMGLGDYIHILYPNRANLELTVSRYIVQETGAYPIEGQPIEHTRYKAVYLTENNPQYAMSDFLNRPQLQLNNVDIVPVKLQLIDRSLEPIRIKTIQGSFSNYDNRMLLQSLLAGESAKILVDGRPAIDGMDLVEPENLERHQHVVLTSGTHITAIPTLLQERFRGVYTAGIGNYLQTYRSKKLWFVYPLYNVLRFDRPGPKVIFYAVNSNRYMEVERTYRIESDIVHVAITGQKIPIDHTDIDAMSRGNGFRLTDSRPMLKKPVEMHPEGPIGLRTNLNTEIVNRQREDNLNYAPVLTETLTSNTFSQYSRVAERQAGRMNVVWENSNPDLIIPGMPCRYVYLDGDQIRSITGIVLYCHHFTQMGGRGMFGNVYLTSTALTIYYQPDHTTPRL